jgi:hypothetical protein
MYIFRNANTIKPFGAISTWNYGVATANVIAAALTLIDPSGDSCVAQTFYNNATTGAWVNKIPGNFIAKNQNARMASNQAVVTEGATVDQSTMTHSVAGTARSLSFEVLAGQPPLPFDPLPRYLVVAGGGGGGSGGSGGGGAGGVLTGSLDLSPGTVYTITVGAGGAAGVGTNIAGASGTNSSLNSLIAIGGGGGGSPSGAAKSGGSGGGAGRGLAGAGQIGGSGTAGQGNKGGNIPAAATNNCAGGGGGAGEPGQDGYSTTISGNGGNGVRINITGTDRYFGGGGGAGIYGSGTPGSTNGGAGGGGVGGAVGTSSGVAGTANTGGGGGGGDFTTSSKPGGAGGSGVVILSIPTDQYTGVTTGNPVVTTFENNTILEYKTSGTYATEPSVEEQPYLYGIEQVNKPNRVVDFTALKGFVPEGDAIEEEAFMFRCSTISGLDGYVPRNFTKTFPSGTAYTKFECTLADQYGDGIPANNGEMLKTISFTAYPTA